MSTRKLYDLEFIKSHAMSKDVNKKDWKSISLKLQNLVSKKGDDGLEMKPIKNLYKYFMDTSDISHKMATTAILYVLSATTRRDQIVRSVQANKHLNLWVMLIGQSSNSRKTTTEGRIKKLLKSVMDHLPEEDDYRVNSITSNFTGPAIINVLEKNPRGYLIKSEASRFIKSFKREFNQELPEAMCQLYDCDDKVEYLSRTRDLETVDNPYVVLWGATTPYAYEHFTDDLFMQGFFQRFLFCLELEKERYDPLSFGEDISQKHKEFSSELLNAMRSSTIKTLEPTGTNTWINYQNYVRDVTMNSYEDERSIVYPYWGRVSEFVLKIAGILQLAKSSYLGIEGYGDTGVAMVQEQTLDLAIEIVQMYEQEFLALIKKVRFVNESAEVKTDRNILEQVKSYFFGSEERVLSHPDLLTNFDLTTPKMKPIIQTLIESEFLSFTYPVRNIQRGSAPKLYYVTESFANEEAAQCMWFLSKDARDKYKCDGKLCVPCTNEI